MVALGIGIDGTKHPLGLVEGSTENTRTVTDLLVGLGERGLDTTRAIFVGIDGAKALRAAVTRVFDHANPARVARAPGPTHAVISLLPARLPSTRVIATLRQRGGVSSFVGDLVDRTHP